MIRDLLSLIVVVGIVAGAWACTKETYLAPNDQELVKGAIRADNFIVTRNDGGEANAARGLADSACKNLVKLQKDAKLDAGVCP
jgi:hypothetical protein